MLESVLNLCEVHDLSFLFLSIYMLRGVLNTIPLNKNLSLFATQILEHKLKLFIVATHLLCRHSPWEHNTGNFLLCMLKITIITMHF